MDNVITREDMDMIIEEIMGAANSEWMDAESKTVEIERIITGRGLATVMGEDDGEPVAD